jgi:hypothetical protein
MLATNVTVNLTGYLGWQNIAWVGDRQLKQNKFASRQLKNNFPAYKATRVGNPTTKLLNYAPFGSFLSLFLLFYCIITTKIRCYHLFESDKFYKKQTNIKIAQNMTADMYLMTND